MANYRARVRIRTEGALFLPGDEVWGLSETDATALLAAGQIEAIRDESDTTPKTPAAKTSKPNKKGA